MKHLRLLMPVVLTALLVTSCASQKRAWYLQDAQPFTPEQIAENGQIRIKPLDRLTIVVNSKDPELAVPFNSSSSLSSLTGATNYGSATNQSLQIRTVDENGHGQQTYGFISNIVPSALVSYPLFRERISR